MKRIGRISADLRKVKLEALRREIAKAVESPERGEGKPLDIEATRRREGEAGEEETLGLNADGYPKISPTRQRNPGTTAPPSRKSCSVRTVMSVSER